MEQERIRFSHLVDFIDMYNTMYQAEEMFKEFYKKNKQIQKKSVQIIKILKQNGMQISTIESTKKIITQNIEFISQYILPCIILGLKDYIDEILNVRLEMTERDFSEGEYIKFARHLKEMNHTFKFLEENIDDLLEKICIL